MILLFKINTKIFKKKPYYFVSVGFLVFFVLTSLRGHVEPHWTVIASIPMVILFLQFIKEKPSWQKYAHYRFRFIGFGFHHQSFIAHRSFTQKLEFTGKEQKYKALAEKIGKTPVLFTWFIPIDFFVQLFYGK